MVTLIINPATLASAQRRANETGTHYIVTDYGHVLMHCTQNINMARNIGCKAVLVVRPISPVGPFLPDDGFDNHSQ